MEQQFPLNQAHQVLSQQSTRESQARSDQRAADGLNTIEQTAQRQRPFQNLHDHSQTLMDDGFRHHHGSPPLRATNSLTFSPTTGRLAITNVDDEEEAVSSSSSNGEEEEEEREDLEVPPQLEQTDENINRTQPIHQLDQQPSRETSTTARIHSSSSPTGLFPNTSSPSPSSSSFPSFVPDCQQRNISDIVEGD